MRYVRAFLDNSLEIAIALARLVAMLGALALVGLSVATVWLGGRHTEQWIASLIVVTVFTLGAGFAGFYTFGNPEWRRGAADN